MPAEVARVLIADLLFCTGRAASPQLVMVTGAEPQVTPILPLHPTAAAAAAAVHPRDAAEMQVKGEGGSCV